METTPNTDRLTPQQLETIERGASHETDLLCAEIRATWAERDALRATTQPANQQGFTSVDFFTGHEAVAYVATAAICEADIAEMPAGTRGWIRSRHHIGGGAYEIKFQVGDSLQFVRLNRTRFLKFFRLLSGTEIDAWEKEQKEQEQNPNE